MARVDAVVWDMDGTLFDSVDTVTTAYADVVAATGLPRPTPEAVVAGYHLGPPAALLGSLLGRACDAADLDRLHAAVASHASRVRPYDGVAAAVAAIADVMPVAVFTGASTRAAEILLTAAGLRDRLGCVLGSDALARPKPDPEGLLLACERLGVDPRRAAYVGDSPLDLACARAAGSVAVAACWGHQHDPGAPRDVSAATPADLVRWVLG